MTFSKDCSQHQRSSGTAPFLLERLYKSPEGCRHLLPFFPRLYSDVCGWQLAETVRYYTVTVTVGDMKVSDWQRCEWEESGGLKKKEGKTWKLMLCFSRQFPSRSDIITAIFTRKLLDGSHITQNVLYLCFLTVMCISSLAVNLLLPLFRKLRNSRNLPFVVSPSGLIPLPG